MINPPTFPPRVGLRVDVVMKESYKGIMEEEGASLVIDAKLVERLTRFNTEFVNKSENHVLFFSNPYMGVWPARFVPGDRLKWFDTVLGINDVAVASRSKNIPGVKSDWVRATDPINITAVWLVHMFMMSNLPNAVKREGAIQALMLMHFKFITSLDSRYFPHGADMATAQASYNSLSYKFSLKKYGSWFKLFRARAEEIVSSSSIHKRTIERFTDEGVLYMISDIQVRVRDVVKNQYASVDSTRAQDAAVLVKSSVVNINGDVLLREVQRNETRYTRYLETISHDKHRFIKEDLMVVVAHAMPNMPEKSFEAVLEHIVKVSGTPAGTKVDAFLQKVILHAISYVTGDRSITSSITDTYTLIRKLRQSYTSARYRDPLFLEMQKDAEELIRPLAKTRNNALIASIRTGLFLYIVLRVFAIDHYK